MKRVALVVLMLAVVGVAACGDEQPAPSSSEPVFGGRSLAEWTAALRRGAEDHQAAIDALSEIGIKAVPALTAAALRSADDLQRSRAVYALGGIGARIAWALEVAAPSARDAELKSELSRILDVLATIQDGKNVSLRRTAGQAVTLINSARDAGWDADHGKGPTWSDWWDRNKSPIAVEVGAAVSRGQLAEARRFGVPAAIAGPDGLVFVLVPSGTFVMGSPGGEEGRSTKEPQDEVTFPRPFYMQVTEVTNGQFRRWRPTHRSGAHRVDRRGDGLIDLDSDLQPVVRVSREEAEGFAQWVDSLDAGHRYRLPTEAEWEYACRAGSAGRFAWGAGVDDACAYANALDKSAVGLDLRGAFPKEDFQAVSSPVGSFLPNRWGLHDLHGNVWELCTATTRLDAPQAREAEPHSTLSADLGYVLRGGCWQSRPEDVRCARRAAAVLPSGTVGFRLVSPLPEPKGGK